MQIDLKKVVAAPQRAAFKVIADVEQWPQFVRSIKSVEMLTPGRLRVGARFRETRIIFGAETTDEMRVETLERSRRLRLISENRGIPYELDHVVDGLEGGGSRLLLIFRPRPDAEAAKSLQALLSPFLQIALRDELERDLGDFAAYVTVQVAAGLIKAG